MSEQTQLTIKMSVDDKLTEHLHKAIAILSSLTKRLGISSRRYRPRNTRIQRVQAKRKRLYLGQDGRCCDLRTRKASYALRLAEEAWYKDMTTRKPLRSDYEHRSARMRRKEKKRALKWKPLEFTKRELLWMRYEAQLTEFLDNAGETIKDISAAMCISPQEARYALAQVYRSYNKMEER